MPVPFVLNGESRGDDATQPTDGVPRGTLEQLSDGAFCCNQ